VADITERLRELSKARWDKDAWERETTVRIPAEPDRDIDLVLANAANEIDRLRARVAELEKANGEPVFWKINYPHDMPTKVLLSAPVVVSDKSRAEQILSRLRVSYEGVASIVPLYTATPAPTVDVDAIDDDALLRGRFVFAEHIDALPAFHVMRAALRAIFDKGECRD
jgi:hypothetical protein